MTYILKIKILETTFMMNTHEILSIKNKFKEKKFSNDLLRNRMMNELYHEIVPVLLHEDDLNL